MEKSGGDLDERECWDLLASESVGRIALSVRALPAILLVQYYLDGRTLGICLGQHRIPTTSVNDAVMAFAADAIDDSSNSGWTIQVQGLAHVPMASGVPRDCGQPAAGQIVHIEPATISGHRFILCPFISSF